MQTKVKIPDGSIVTVEHPEGASDEDILNFAKENYTSEPKDEPFGASITKTLNKFYDPTEYGFKDQLIDSAAFEFMDEATGAVAGAGTALKELVKSGADALTGKGISFDTEAVDRSYTDVRDKERKRAKKYRDENENAAMAASLLGGLAVGGPIFKAAVKTPSMLRKMGQGALVGTGLGTAQGIGASEKEDMTSLDAVFDVGTTGLLTGLLGGAIPPLGALGANIVRGVGTSRLMKGAEDVVGKGVRAISGKQNKSLAGHPSYIPPVSRPISSRFSPRMDDIQEEITFRLDDMTPEQAIKNLKDLGPEGAFLDVAQGLQTAAKGLRRGKKSAMTRPIQDVVEKRKAKTEERILFNIRQNLSENSDAFLQGELRRSQQVADANKLYDIANKNITEYRNPALMELFQRPKVRLELKQLQENVGELQGLPSNHPKVVDRVYKVFSKKERQGQADPIDQDLRKEMKELIVDENPAYGDALESFSEYENLITIIEKGKDFANTAKSTNEILATIKNLTTAQQKSDYLTGALDSIVRKINRGLKNEASIENAFGGKMRQEALKELFETPADYKKFKRFIKQEVKFKETEKVIKPVTEEGKIPEAGYMEEIFRRFPEQAGDVIAGSKAYALRNFLRGVQGSGVSDKAIQRLVNVLTKEGKSAEDYLKELSKAQKGQKLTNEMRNQISAILSSLGATRIKESKRK